MLNFKHRIRKSSENLALCSEHYIKNLSLLNIYITYQNLITIQPFNGSMIKNNLKSNFFKRIKWLRENEWLTLKRNSLQVLIFVFMHFSDFLQYRRLYYKTRSKGWYVLHNQQRKGKHFTSSKTVCWSIFFAVKPPIMFYSSLQVKVTIKQSNSTEEKYIRTLQKGDFFGEKALQGYVYTVLTINRSDATIEITFWGF